MSATSLAACGSLRSSSSRWAICSTYFPSRPDASFSSAASLSHCALSSLSLASSSDSLAAAAFAASEAFADAASSLV